MKTSAASDLTVGGSILAAHAFKAGLVDECHLFVGPVLVGEGKPAFPGDARVQLELEEEPRFDNGVRVPPLRHPELNHALPSRTAPL
jgi:dihydrofolate reductase